MYLITKHLIKQSGLKLYPLTVPCLHRIVGRELHAVTIVAKLNLEPWWLIAWTTGNAFLPIFVTNWNAQNPPNNCNSYAKKIPYRWHQVVYYDDNSLGSRSRIRYMKLPLGLKKADLKLDVTTWVPRFVQSVHIRDGPLGEINQDQSNWFWDPYQYWF